MSTQRLVRLLIVLYPLVLPATARGQTATGTIAGVVKDTSGAVLPGVTVEAASPALIEKVRTVVTDGQGEYRIVDLRPGSYTITFRLAGFATVKREGLELTTSFTATVNAEMKVGGIEETVTVSGETPVVDISNARQQTTVSRTVLDAIPTTKRIGQYASFIPGATYANPTFQDSGGTAGEGGQFAVHGQRPGDQIVNVEGMTQNMWGLDVYSYNSQTIQEVVVETGGTSAEAVTGGVQLNLIVKDGGNTWSGSFSSSYAGPGLASNNLNDELRARGLQSGASIRVFNDNGGSLGGPIMKDKLWFFTAHRFWSSSKYIQGDYYNKLQGTLFYQPDLSRVAHTDWYYHDDNVRLTWQVTPKHKIAASFSQEDSCNCPVGLSGTGGANAVKGTPESRTRHVFNPMHYGLVSWNYPATNRFLLEAAGSRQQINEHSEPMPEVGPNDIAVTDVGLNLQYGALAGSGLPTGNTFYGSRQRRFTNAYTGRFAASYVTGSHSFKSGFQFKRYNLGREGAYNDPNAIHGALNYTFRNQVPIGVTIWAIPFELVEHTTNVWAYAQDQWAIKKLTLNMGLRFDALNGAAPAHHLPAGIFVPARDFPAVDNIPNFKNLDPRLNVAYDLFGDGKTAFKASVGRYVPYVTATSGNPASNQAVNASRNWIDSNGNFVPDCDLTNPAPNGECGAWSDLTFGQLRAGTRFASDALTGFNKQFDNWQTSASIQQQLRPGMALNVGYFRTWYDNFLVTKNMAVTPADFDPYCITLPTTDSRLPSAGQPLCGFYDIKPNLFGVVDNVRTLASNYGKRSEIYNGVDVTLTARFGTGGQFSGGISVGRTVHDACEIAKNAPETLFGADTLTNTGPGTLLLGTNGSWSPVQYCKVTPPWSAATQAKFLVVYPLPWDFQVSGIYQNFAGIPITATYPAGNALIRPTLGRDVGSCRGAATCNAVVNVELIAPGADYEKRLQQVDLRFARRFKLGRFAVRANADVSNIFNAGNVYATNTGFGSQWLVPYEIMGGRLVRLTGQLDF